MYFMNFKDFLLYDCLDFQILCPTSYQKDWLFFASENILFAQNNSDQQEKHKDIRNYRKEEAESGYRPNA